MRLLGLAAPVAAAAALAGCGGGDDPATPVDAGMDAGPPGPCWPEGPRASQGTATLGTGRDAFQPMPDVLPLEWGAQDGFMLITRVRMTGFPPGNPQDVLDRGNTRTRVLAYFDDTNVPLNRDARCPFRYGYVPTGQGDYEILEELPVVFDTCWRSSSLFGKRLRVELELLDSTGEAYAKDTKIVTAAPPTGYYNDTPGSCPP